MTGPPDPPATSSAILLVALGRQVDAWLDGALEEAGLSLRLFGALGHLARASGVSYTELARRARVTPQSMHATIARLIELGAVAPAGPGRGKRALLEVTPRGQELLAAGQAALAVIDAHLRGIGGLPADRDLFRLLSEVSRRTLRAEGAPGDEAPADDRQQ